MCKKYFLLTLLCLSAHTLAEPGCIDADIISGKLIDKFCWGCVVPIRVSGVNIGEGEIPEDAVDDPLCVCYDDLNVPEPGFTHSMWMPARLIELQRVPGCSSVFNGVRFPFDRLKEGMIHTDSSTDTAELTYLHYHYYAFPVLMILNMMSNRGCIADGFNDLDLMYMSEVDPTWNNSVLAFFTNPEAAAVANPVAIAACAADAAAAATGNPINGQFWCAGAWGHIYPLAGDTHGSSENVRKSSLLKVRAQSALHRRFLAHKTSGRDAMCASQVDPIMDKDMYGYTLIHPLPETDKKHVLGAPTLVWGVGRTIPAVGEDLVYVIWRWSDCCSRF
ncbi:MAG: TraU family protein [Cellvibrionaceae bacterium]|nr:TraU family protein [Cellvibrionaceae bacterium]